MENHYTQAPAWAWIAFAVTVLVMLAADLFAYGGKRGDSRRTALTWTVIWIVLGLLFGVVVWIAFGDRLAHEYFATYAIEKSLSLDNLFVFLLIFKTLNIPHPFQHKVLFWGILGAVVFRGVFIFLGVAALRRWEWVSYVFGAILIYAAYRALREHPEKRKQSRLIEWLAQHLPVSRESHSGKFITKSNGKICATPLLLAIVAIELTDILFAIDSVPAALSITRNEFIVYSSNIFAILGLRALYLFLSSSIAQLRYLHYGLAAVLAFAGIKIVAGDALQIHPLASVAVIAAMIGASVWASLLREPTALRRAGQKMTGR